MIAENINDTHKVDMFRPYSIYNLFCNGRSTLISILLIFMEDQQHERMLWKNIQIQKVHIL